MHDVGELGRLVGRGSTQSLQFFVRSPEEIRQVLGREIKRDRGGLNTVLF
jgi:hypothetical protein